MEVSCRGVNSSQKRSAATSPDDGDVIIAGRSRHLRNPMATHSGRPRSSKNRNWQKNGLNEMPVLEYSMERIMQACAYHAYAYKKGYGNRGDIMYSVLDPSLCNS